MSRDAGVKTGGFKLRPAWVAPPERSGLLPVKMLDKFCMIIMLK